MIALGWLVFITFLDLKQNKLFISECHSKAYRYPEIKNWFLKKYPEIVNNGMPSTEEDSTKAQEGKVEEIEFDDAA